MTLEDFRYIFENRSIKIVHRDKAHSMRCTENSFYSPNSSIPDRIYNFCDDSIDVFARFWKNGTVSNWEQIDINPTKDSIEHYLNTVKDLVHLKLEVPQHQFIIRILYHILYKKYKKDISMSLLIINFILLILCWKIKKD